MVDVNGSCQLSADSQPKRLAWSEGWRPSGGMRQLANTVERSCATVAMGGSAPSGGGAACFHVTFGILVFFAVMLSVASNERNL